MFRKAGNSTSCSSCCKAMSYNTLWSTIGLRAHCDSNCAVCSIPRSDTRGRETCSRKTCGVDYRGGKSERASGPCANSFDRPAKDENSRPRTRVRRKSTTPQAQPPGKHQDVLFVASSWHTNLSVFLTFLTFLKSSRRGRRWPAQDERGRIGVKVTPAAVKKR